MQFRIGQQVRVMLPPGESTGTNTVEHFQGKASVIKTVHINRKGKSLLGYSYTLLGCKTKWGIDLEFCEEWLVPLDEGKGEQNNG